jgi:hypothetical protein
LGVQVEGKEYGGLGHWYNADMLRDVLIILKALDGWENAVHV